MNLLDLYYEIQNTLYPVSLNQLSYGDFITALNQAIRVINAEVEKPNELVHIYPFETKLIAEINDVTIAEEVEIIGGNNYLYPDMSWIDEDKALIVPNNWTKILAIYKDNALMQQVPMPKLKTDYYTDEYSIFNRTIYFNLTKDMLDIYMKLRREYEFPTQANMENYLGIPDNGYQLLFSAVMVALLSRPRFNDMNLLNFYRNQYYELLTQFSQLNLTRNQPTVQWRD